MKKAILASLYIFMLSSESWAQFNEFEIPSSFNGNYEFAGSYYRTSPSECPTNIQLSTESNHGKTYKITVKPTGDKKTLSDALTLAINTIETIDKPFIQKENGKFYDRLKSKIVYKKNDDYPEDSYYEVEQRVTHLKKYLLKDLPQDEYNNILQFSGLNTANKSLSIKIYHRNFGDDSMMEICNYKK